MNMKTRYANEICKRDMQTRYANEYLQVKKKIVRPFTV